MLDHMKFAHEMEDGSVSTDVNYQVEQSESNDYHVREDVEDEELEENSDIKMEVFETSDENVETVECKPDFENEDIESPSKNSEKSSEKSYDTVLVSADDKIGTDDGEGQDEEDEEVGDVGEEVEEEEIVEEEEDEEKVELERENIIKKIVVRVSVLCSTKY